MQCGNYGCHKYILQLSNWSYHAINIFHPQLQVGNIFGRVCLSVFVYVCLSVWLSIKAITYEPFHIGTLFLVWRYILTISSSSLSIKVIGSRLRPYVRNSYLLINLLFLCMWLQVIIKVKVTYQSQGHSSRLRSKQCQGQIKVTFKERYSYMGGCIWINRVLVFILKSRLSVGVLYTIYTV